MTILLRYEEEIRDENVKRTLMNRSGKIGEKDFGVYSIRLQSGKSVYSALIRVL